MIINLKDLENQLDRIPEPTYKFNIGDEVTIGRLENVVVSDIYFEGKGYEIDYTRTDNNYGRPTTSHNNKRIVTWLEIRKKHNNKESFIKNENIFINYSQRGLSDILSKRYYFGVNMNPEYQRHYVWELEDKVGLIEAIFNKIDIGKFVFREHKIKDTDDIYEIVDGKQRINTICEFYEDRFPYREKYFSDLSIRDQDYFENYPISYGSISNISDKEVIHVFLMLNSSGKVMSKEHLDKVRDMYDTTCDTKL